MSAAPSAAPSVAVRPADPRSPEGRALLGASHGYLASLYPAEHNHYLSVDELAAPHVSFLLAERGGEAVGCAALARLDGYGEIKSMFVDPARRGGGVGAALMAALGDLARAHGLAVLRLETGDTLVAAQALYRRHGFAERGPFGDYAPGPHSVFMEKRL
jgi:putative acetyltransferase